VGAEVVIVDNMHVIFYIDRRAMDDVDRAHHSYATLGAGKSVTGAKRNGFISFSVILFGSSGTRWGRAPIPDGDRAGASELKHYRRLITAHEFLQKAPELPLFKLGKGMEPRAPASGREAGQADNTSPLLPLRERRAT
jgi:hypothetical protein